MRIPNSVCLVLLAALPFAAAAADHEVLVGQGGNTFQPNFLEIRAGDTVTFRQVAGFHNVATLAGAVTAFRCGPNGCDGVGSGNGEPGGGVWSQTVAFPTMGTIDYLCDVHGQVMSGSIVVNPVPVTLQKFEID
ncbi:plastocyanin [Tahibacter aquaticus]|uniref:Plastocyanin n=1 Tax=Tahibacter aquaticus TaxID=520092 RepID=A0A4R6Z764_9GAMM|nr:plastocyanin/azurin family copper-binding protein [Tahibacter aquaticus]TDR47605.1 plastocyanin [Tahibacter aquaticus]